MVTGLTRCTETRERPSTRLNRVILIRKASVIPWTQLPATSEIVTLLSRNSTDRLSIPPLLSHPLYQRRVNILPT